MHLWDRILYLYQVLRVYKINKLDISLQNNNILITFVHGSSDLLYLNISAFEKQMCTLDRKQITSQVEL